MKKQLISISFIALTLLGFTTSSCKKDKIKGCMNPDATNYSSSVTEDDGSCTFKRDKFIGNYIGSRLCTIVLADTSMTLQITGDGIEYTKLLLNDFPESGSVVKATVNSQNETLLIIPPQEISNDLETYSLSGTASYYQGKIILNYIKNNAGTLDTCGLNIDKQN
ncbi:MAG TPA: hypothetical protein PL185_02165 [Flavobacteriales bacterium]|nr:hypothetical protein [Flavobacteriales bacterium]